MHIRLFGAALAAGLLVSVAFAPSARADIVLLRDGKCLPKEVTLPPGGAPTDEQMEDHKGKKLEPLGYDQVKLGSTEVPVGMIAAVWTYDTWVNPDFSQGDRDYGDDRYEDAAESFRRAAEALKGSSKQLAMWKRAVALASHGDADAMVAAIEELVTEFPKTFFLGDVQRRRARVLAGKGDKAGVTAALEKVTASPGMNKHDLHDTELLRIFLEQVVQAGRDPARWATAEATYRERLKAIEGESGAKTELEDLRLRALVGIGRSLVGQNKAPEARKSLDQVVASPASLGDKAMLAAAYNALGDVAFLEAKATQEGAAGNDELKKKAAEQLDGALLHYLRVTELYWDEADKGDLYSARLNAARVFAQQFTMSNDKDCDVAVRAFNFYVGASRLAPPGLELNALKKEANAFKARMDKVPCK